MRRFMATVCDEWGAGEPANAGCLGGGLCWPAAWLIYPSRAGEGQHVTLLRWAWSGCVERAAVPAVRIDEDRNASAGCAVDRAQVCRVGLRPRQIDVPGQPSAWASEVGSVS